MKKIEFIVQEGNFWSEKITEKEFNQAFSDSEVEGLYDRLFELPGYYIKRKVDYNEDDEEIDFECIEIRHPEKYICEFLEKKEFPNMLLMKSSNTKFFTKAHIQTVFIIQKIFLGVLNQKEV